MPTNNPISPIGAIGQNVAMLLRRTILCCLTLAGGPACAAGNETMLDLAEQHIRLQTQGLAGKVTVTVGPLDASRQPPCNALEAFTPQGGRLLGKTHVGIRCLGPKRWTVLVPAQIAVAGNYVTTSRPLVAGQVIQPGDLQTLSGDLSTLPTGVVSDPGLAIGKTVRNSLGAGQPLRADQLLAPLVIRQGQTVRVISTGAGFAVSSEGTALNNAAEGQLVQIRMSSGQTIRGTAGADGSVEVAF